MPSLRLNNQSGGQPLFSGSPFSGQGRPVGSIQLRMDPNISGFAYVGLSGGVTVRSGGPMDGMPLGPSEPMLVPVGGCGDGLVSGRPQIWIATDLTGSGALLFYECY